MSMRRDENKSKIVPAFRTSPTIWTGLQKYQAALAVEWGKISMPSVINRLLAEGLARVAQKGEQDCQAR